MYGSHSCQTCLCLILCNMDWESNTMIALLTQVLDNHFINTVITTNPSLCLRLWIYRLHTAQQWPSPWLWPRDPNTTFFTMHRIFSVHFCIICASIFHLSASWSWIDIKSLKHVFLFQIRSIIYLLFTFHFYSSTGEFHLQLQCWCWSRIHISAGWWETVLVLGFVSVLNYSSNTTIENNDRSVWCRTWLS